MIKGINHEFIVRYHRNWQTGWTKYRRVWEKKFPIMKRKDETLSFLYKNTIRKMDIHEGRT